MSSNDSEPSGDSSQAVAEKPEFSVEENHDVKHESEMHSMSSADLMPVYAINDPALWEVNEATREILKMAYNKISIN